MLPIRLGRLQCTLAVTAKSYGIPSKLTEKFKDRYNNPASHSVLMGNSLTGVRQLETRLYCCCVSILSQTIFLSRIWKMRTYCFWWCYSSTDLYSKCIYQCCYMVFGGRSS